MRARVLVVAASLLFLALPERSAHATWVELWAKAGPGVLAPIGASKDTVRTTTGQAVTSSDFFDVSSGGLLDLEAGVHILFLDGVVTYYEMFDGDGSKARWLQASVGAGVNFQISSLRWDFGGSIGYGVGKGTTLKTDNDALFKKGVVFEGHAGFELMFNRFLGLAAEPKIQYHVLVAPYLDLDDASGSTKTGLAFIGTLGLRFHLGI